MVNYQEGKIYKLVGGGLTYYGSTCCDLRFRLCGHKTDFKRNINISSKLLFETGDKVEIILVEYFPCNNKMELNARERWYIENNDCVNMIIPTRTIKEYYEANKEEIKEQKKEYYEAHKEQRKEKDKQYREVNKEQKKEQNKEYYEAKKDHLKKQNKEYYKAHKEEVLKKMSEKITCECGAVIRKDNLLRHNNSKRHILAT